MYNSIKKSLFDITPNRMRLARDWYIATISRLAEFSARNAVLLIIAATVVCGLLLYYMTQHFSINTKTSDMLDSRLPFRQAQRDLDLAFPELAGNIVIVIDADTVLRANELAHQLAVQLRSDPTRFDSVYEPAGGGFFKHNGLLYLDLAALEGLSNSLAKAQPMLGTLSADMNLGGLFTVLGRALDQKLSPDDEKMLRPVFDTLSENIENQLAHGSVRLPWKSRLFGDSLPTEAGNRGFVLVRPRLDFSQVESAQEPIDFIRESIAKMYLDASHEKIRLTGEPIMDNEELGNAIAGIKFSGFLSFALVSLITVFGLRSPRHILAILITLATGLIFTAAFATAAIGALNVISINFAILFIGMGVDFGIQVGLRYKEEIQAGHDHFEAVRRTGAGLGGPLSLAAVAAAASFFSFLPTSYLGLAELGVISGVGMGIATVLNLTLLPALLTVLPRSLEFRHSGKATQTSSSFESGRHRKKILWAGALVTVAAAALLPRVRFDFNPLNMKDQHSESVATFKELLADPNTTPYTISILAANLESAEALARKAQSLHSVDKAITLGTFVPEEQDEKFAIIDDINLLLGPLLAQNHAVAASSLADEVRATDQLEQKLATTDPTKISPVMSSSVARLQKALLALKAAPGWPEAALVQLRENAIGDLPETLDMLRELLDPTPVQLEDLPAELKARYLSRDGRARLEIFPREDLRDNDALKRFVREVQTVAPEATDAAVVLSEGGEAVVRAALEATVLALIATALLLLAVLRRFLDTLLILIPLLFSLLLTAASSVLIGIPFDLANIIALPLLLGLSNAYGIYLMLRLRAEGSLNKLFRTNTPRAILFSTLTAIAAFGTLAFSPHRGLSGMGILVTLSLTCAVLSTLLLLPAIVACQESRKSKW
ncbi:MAG: MMPL family transporter [Methylococcales bacterium]